MGTTRIHKAVFGVLLAGWLGLAPTTAWASGRAGQSYAFLVACAAYDKAELAPLKYTRNDILDFHKALLQSGFSPRHVVLMHDEQKKDYLPEARKIRRLLKALLAGLGEQDTLVVALSGHGVQFKGEEQAYFCPVDADLKDRSTLLDLAELYGELRHCKARRKLLLVDACRDAPQAAPGKGRAEVSLERLAGLTRVPVPTGMAALFSCSAGEQSYEDPALKHGVFFHHVIQGWQGKAADPASGQVTLDGLRRYVAERTQDYVLRQFRKAQVPFLKAEYSGTWLLRRINLALDKVRQGNQARDKKDYDLALSYFAEALRLDPRCTAAYTSRAWVYNQVGRYDEVVADCNQALRLDPKCARAFQSRGWAYHCKKQTSRSLADLSQALRLNPNLHGAYYDRGRGHADARNFDQAIADYTDAIRLSSQWAWAYFYRGRAYFDKMEYIRAEADLSRAIQLDPKNAWAYNIRGHVHSQTGDPGRAIADYTQALTLDPKFAWPHQNRGALHLKAGRFDQAIRDCSAALRLDPKMTSAYVSRGQAYHRTRDYGRAVADFTQAIRLDPHQALVYNERGLSYYCQKDTARAIADFTRAIKRNPKFVVAYRNRSLAYKAKGDKLWADFDWKKARALDPGVGQ